MLKREDIQIRDPFVLVDNNAYYLYGTTGENCWGDVATGFLCYKSTDLENWEGPFDAFVPPSDFWADRNFWAPEVHKYGGKYYMFASFKAPDKCRGTQLLVCDTPDGAFTPLTDAPITPSDWECLDGTLYIDDDGKPWIIFCREWLQVVDGEMWAMPLSDDLSAAVGAPILLFNASSASWERGSLHDGKTVYITDGPFLYKTKKGSLLMIWSSLGEEGYAVGIARSADGKITSKWSHDEKTLFSKDGGHGMIFKSLDGRLLLSLHAPNHTPMERAHFFEIEEVDDTLRLK